MGQKNFARIFSVVVRQYRKDKKLSQELLAERAGLSSKMISLVERGQRNPSLVVADAIARGLAVPLWRLIKDTEDLRRSQMKRRSA